MRRQRISGGIPRHILQELVFIIRDRARCADIATPRDARMALSPRLARAMAQEIEQLLGAH